MSSQARAIRVLQSNQRELAQARPRPARSRLFVDVKGVGDLRLEGDSSLSFHTAFLSEPSFTWGLAAVSSIASGVCPSAFAMVTEYNETSAGLFLGAGVLLRVSGTTSNTTVRFSLVFEGVALRTLSQAIL